MTRQPIEVQVQSAIRIDASLQVGDTQQTVEVTSDTPFLQTQNAPSGTKWKPVKCRNSL